MGNKGNDVAGTYEGYSNNGSGFALLVVLFILLIIVGAAFWNGSNAGGYGGYSGGYSGGYY